MTALNINSSYSPAALKRISPATHRLRLAPHPAALRTVEPAEHKQERMHDWVACPSCGKTFCGGAIVDSAPEPVRDFLAAHYTGLLIRRRLFCDHEDLIVSWYQAISDRGVLGLEVGPHALIRERQQVEKFLREHPEARGVAQ